MSDGKIPGGPAKAGPKAASRPGPAGVTFTVRAIGVVRTPFRHGRPVPKHFERFAHGTVQVFPEFAGALDGLDRHAHLWLVVYRPRVRGEPAADSGGVGEGTIGLSRVIFRGIEGTRVRVEGVDLDDGTPLLGIGLGRPAEPAPRTGDTGFAPRKRAHEETSMVRIAIPMAQGRFSEHFGGAEAFLLSDVEEGSGAVMTQRLAQAPPHERGAFPRWLQAQGVAVVLAGGMGPRAVQMLERSGVRVVTGVAGGEPQVLIKAFLSGSLTSTGQACSGGHLHRCGDHGEDAPQCPELDVR